MFYVTVVVVGICLIGRIASKIRDKEIEKEIGTLLARARKRAKQEGYYYDGYPYREDGLIDCTDDDVREAVLLMHTHYFLGIIPLTFDPWG